MYLNALALMSNIALLIMAGSIWATSLVMLACSWLRVASLEKVNILLFQITLRAANSVTISALDNF